MNTMYSYNNRKAKRLKLKLEAIESKYPNLNLYNSEFMRDIRNHQSIYKEYLYASVDTKACKSDNPDLMCTNCICWKKTRANSM